MTLSRCVVIAILAACCILGCSDDPTAPEKETLSHFEISIPAAARAGEEFQLAVTAVGSRGTSPFADFGGAVQLAVSGGEIAPAVVTLAAGMVEAPAAVTGTAGSCAITASAGGKSGLAYLTVLLDSLPGDPEALASTAIPDIRYRADYRDFSDDHPALGGMYLSFNNLVVVFVPGTTVGEANNALSLVSAGIAGGITGSAGTYEGVLALRLATSTHAGMESALSALRAHPRVARAVQDALLALDFTPRPNAGTPADWIWNNPPAGANWNLERIRAPQMWNLNAAAGKRNRLVPTLVFDMGFAVAHTDLAFTALNTFSDPGDHGLHVAGIIGAKVDNGFGIDGVNPFASLRLYEYTLPGAPAGAGMPEAHDWRASIQDAIIWNLRDLIVNHPGLRVVNVSLGYNWSARGIDTQIDADAQLLADTQGGVFADLVRHLAFSDLFPLIVASAGNDSRGAAGIGDQYAVYSSPICNAALAHGAPAIVIVEAVENAPGAGQGEAARCAFSNLGGHVSAPGRDIWSLSRSAPSYRTASGTSMAAPHVAGLAGFLLAIYPSLTHQDLKELIISNAKSIPTGASRIDAWASALDIDRIRGGNDVLTMLCDIDDGTEDGNLRIFLRDKTLFNGEDADGDGGRGDGVVDMSDFRRWRDWLHQALESEGLALDGGAGHVKRDLNGDRRIEGAALENVYPLGDFNGDGRLSAIAKSHVPGALGREATDLEVLQAVFSDPHYDAADLDDLLESADITFDLRSFFRYSNDTAVWVEISDAISGSSVDLRLCSLPDSVQVFTLPVSAAGYRCRMIPGAFDLEFDDRTFPAPLCGDEYVRPIGFVKLSPTGSFLRICNDSATDPVIIDLVPLGVKPGDRMLLSARGGYFNGSRPRYRMALAVFSSTATLLGPGNQFRVPGAINAGDEYEMYTEDTLFCEGVQTDIPEDFGIEPSATVTVPAGAKYLFLCAKDKYYEDNVDYGDFGVELAVIRRP